MRSLSVLVLIVVVLMISDAAHAAGRFALGPEFGFAFQTNRDPSGQGLEGAPGLSFGLSGVYQFGGELSDVAVDYSINVIRTFQLTYRGTSIGGATGTYRENALLIEWLTGGRYYFGHQKWKPFAGLDFGFTYLRRTDIGYRDQFNAALPDPPVTSHLNAAIVPEGGIEYRPTFRWAIGAAVRVVLNVRSTGVIPGVRIPVTLHIAF